MSVPDSRANLTEFTKHRCHNGGSGYPLMRLTALVACGTRTVIDVVFGPTGTGEITHAGRLARSAHAGMILLLDRNVAARDLIATLTATGAEILVRCKTGRVMPVLARYPDGPYLSMLGAVKVRVVDAEIAITTSRGRRTRVYRLATTLLDHHRHPAADLATLYHQRWEIETSYLELKSTILGGRVLRARTPAGVTQEVCALLVTYQLLRLAMADATSTQHDLDPDRASFTIALHAARDLLIQATTVIADSVIDLIGTIGRLVLANLIPNRRIRTSPRVVKRAFSKHNARGTINRTTHKATISIDILTPAEPRQPSPAEHLTTRPWS